MRRKSKERHLRQRQSNDVVSGRAWGPVRVWEESAFDGCRILFLNRGCTQRPVVIFAPIQSTVSFK